MSKKQTRRCISVSAEAYQIIKAYGKENNCSMSSLVEGFIRTVLPDVREPKPSVIEVVEVDKEERRQMIKEAVESNEKIFTF